MICTATRPTDAARVLAILTVAGQATLRLGTPSGTVVQRSGGPVHHVLRRELPEVPGVDYRRACCVLLWYLTCIEVKSKVGYSYLTVRALTRNIVHTAVITLPLRQILPVQ